MTSSRLVCSVLLSAALGGVFAGCNEESGVEQGQLKIDSAVTTCEADDGDCRTVPAVCAAVEVTRGDTVVTARTNQDGRVSFALSPGDYDVTVTLGILETMPSPVTLSRGQVVDLTANLPPVTAEQLNRRGGAGELDGDCGAK